jgi:hypothetical protein
MAARAYLEGRAIAQPVVNKELEGWPAHQPRGDRRMGRVTRIVARALVDEGLGIVANQDESLATAYLCAIGLRAEADRADESRMRQRHDERDDADAGRWRIARRRTRCALTAGAFRRMETGVSEPWWLQCEAEATRLFGGSDASAWVRAGGCVGGPLHAVRRGVLPVAVCRGHARRGSSGQRDRIDPDRGIRHGP